mmetsp:Transcript_17731/g.30013  ORF Transcript_17731/g.30013 Transcript_17731/m.30013 type:complete len:340 (+) Transcript_17731:555-1574(+)
MCSDETEIYAQNTVRRAWKMGYQPVLVQYRGASGIELSSPKTYGCGEYPDVTEAIDYIFEQYCREIDRKIFALGFSMGGNWLGMALGKNMDNFQSKITAAACMQSPIKMRNSFLNMKFAWGGMINWNLGKRYQKVFRENLDYLQPTYLQKYSVDLRDLVENLSGVHEFEEKLNWKLCNQSSFDEYHKNYASGNFMHRIKIPTLFYFTEDDPLINKSCMEFENSKDNENILICSTKHGAHLCHYEHFFTIDQWLPKPALEFFEYFRLHELKKPNPYIHKNEAIVNDDVIDESLLELDDNKKYDSRLILGKIGKSGELRGQEEKDSDDDVVGSLSFTPRMD